MELYKFRLLVTAPHYHQRLISISWNFQALMLQAKGFAHSPGSLIRLNFPSVGSTMIVNMINATVLATAMLAAHKSALRAT